MSSISSSFNGRICEIPKIFVDNFENPSTDGARAYFLSHFHTDHTCGLDSPALREKLENRGNVFIYATKMTAAIIVFKNHHLKEYVKVLELGSNLIVIQGDSEGNQPETFLNVTLIPAGHCLGSTMFLFETITAKVLYTGDFRIRTNDLSKYAALHDKNGDVVKLDVLYVDTTFLESHENLPKRSDIIEEVMVLIKSYLDSDKEQQVILTTGANFGYEYVFNQIYKSLNMKVYVDDKKWDFYSTIQQSVPGVTNDPKETRIFLNKIPGSIKACRGPKKIRFSAYKWSEWNEDKTAIIETDQLVSVCFSTHCSRTELINFVEYLNPKKTVGFPKPYKIKYSPVKAVEDEKFVLSPRKTPTKVPSPSSKACRTDKKVDKSVLRNIFG